MSVTIKLSKPIIVGDSSSDELILREPTVDDVGEIGYPFVASQGDGGTEIKMLPKIILRYASKLGAVPPSALKTLTIQDLFKIQEVVMGFFGDEAETPQT